MRHVVDPGRGIRAAAGPAGLQLTFGDREIEVPLAVRHLVLGPGHGGGAVLALSPDGRVYEVGQGEGPVAVFEDVLLVDGDPGCVAALRRDGILHLVSPRSGTTVGVAPLPRAVAVLGGDGDQPLAALALPGEILALGWEEGSARLWSFVLEARDPKDVHLLGGPAPLCLVRARGGGRDEVLAFLLRKEAWTGVAFEPLPPLDAPPGDALGAAWQGEAWAVLPGGDAWLRWQGHGWTLCDRPLPGPVGSFRCYGTHASLGPATWSALPTGPRSPKKGLPRPLGQARDGRGTSSQLTALPQPSHIL